MKKFTAVLLIMILLVSTLGIVTAFAGVSISGYKEVVAGKTYKYTGKASFTGGDMVGKIEGLGQVNTFDAKAGGLDNASLSGSASISVTIPAGAKPGDTFVITLSGQYSVMDNGVPSDHSFNESKTITVVTKSASPAAETDSNNDKPKATKAPTEWDIAGQNVQAMAAGGTVSADITKDPKIPASVLSAIKEKQGVLTLNYGGYTCTINGAALGTIPEDAIDFSVNMEKDPALSTAAGGQDVYQLHFAHSGQLPGKFTYTFKAEGHAPGDTLYLYYYYDKSGVIEGMQAAQVDANGYVSFDVYHCSSYFVSAAAVAGAVGKDFTADATNAQALTDAQAQITDLQTQLKEAQTAKDGLQSQLDSLNANPSPTPEALTVNAAGSVGQLFGIPYAAFIASMLGVALIAVLLTMIICRVGLFKKKEQNREDIL